MDDDARPAWRTEELGTIEHSVANLVRQMVIAVGGMFVAFAGAEWISSNLLDSVEGLGGFLARGAVFALLGSLSIYITSARPIRSALIAQQEAIGRHEDDLQRQNEHHVLTSRLQSAFDMAETDDDAFGVVAEALATVCDGPAELLLADSSRAHLRRVAVASGKGGPGCGVETPWRCPAVRRSKAMSFPDSEELDACPRLRGRADGPVSALCVPVTVLGTPMGVLHTVGESGVAAEAEARTRMEAVADQAGARIGILRAMAASELQASTDPLTGLLNRRSLEDAVATLRDEHDEWAVAFVDLDHFKRLNDTLGHESGDRALRFFARLLRRVVRDTDMVCRYGGEEFVIVFPGLDAREAQPIVERVAGELADSVRAGEVPELTVSVGLTDSTNAGDPAEAIRQADAAMFRAKQGGRDRIVRAQSGAVDA